MTRLCTLSRFAEVFGGRQDAVFTDDGNGKLGREQMFTSGEKVGRRITRNDFFHHLVTGKYSIGTYPYIDGMCHWGCIDIDVDDLETVANIRDAAIFLGLKPTLETSKSKGYHIWFLFEGKLPAETVREALLFVCKLANYEPIEINPKQVEGDIIGNTVRLPYARLAKKGRQQIFSNEGLLLGLEEWVKDIQLNDPVMLRRASIYNKPRPVVTAASSWESQLIADSYKAVRGSLNYNGTGLTAGKVYAIYEGREYVEAGERDNQFFALANLCYGLGIEQEEALVIARRVWDTQVEDQSGYNEEEIYRKVNRVYQRGSKKR